MGYPEVTRGHWYRCLDRLSLPCPDCPFVDVALLAIHERVHTGTSFAGCHRQHGRIAGRVHTLTGSRLPLRSSSGALPDLDMHYSDLSSTKISQMPRVCLCLGVLCFFAAFASESVTSLLTAHSYVGCITMFLLTFCLAFEIPLILMFLAQIGVVTPMALQRKRRVMHILLWGNATFLMPGSEVWNPVILGGDHVGAL
ncbi:Sec-independent periplasmic protein translocase [Ktedonobacter racemifer DSM 44963]|uniref:Sec-independent periplasmic protein translocase n=1 Tax=Ktedonobacter racemifer DSM 44963 TaxID=485913 RepID=D6U2U9_KTERA|nr:Sec-independent periplasmic protein translocase [Ktedonobacter racemifer DSM 44963]